jgi:hypothetical protein
MERVSGWYKRQALLLWLAIGTVALFNVDSLELAQRLMRDPALRRALVAQAEQAAKAPPATPPNGVPAVAVPRRRQQLRQPARTRKKHSQTLIA